MSTFEALRERLAPFYTSTVTDSGIHSVIFQPYLGKKVEPEDRVVTHEWNILGQCWTFLVVCDGLCPCMIDALDNTLIYFSCCSRQGTEVRTLQITLRRRSRVAFA